MKFSQYRYLLITALIVLGLTNLQGCDFITKKPSIGVDIDSTQEETITRDKEMAKLLVEASEKNYEVIEIVEKINDMAAPEPIKEVAEDLMADHKILSNAYDRIAKESLISIPDEVTDSTLKSILKHDDNLEPILNKITENIETQINALNRLEKAVDNEDIANLTFKSKRVLEENLQRMENVINSI